MRVKTEKLKNAFQIVDNVPLDPTVTSSQYIRFKSDKGLKLTATGRMHGESRAAVSHGNEEAWEFFVDRKLLSAFLSAAVGEDTTLTYSKDSLILETSGQKLKVAPPKEPVAGYGTWPETSVVKLNVEANDLALLSEYCADNISMDKFAVVKLTKGFGTIATDSIFLVMVLDQALTTELNLPPQMAAQFAKAGVAEVSVGKTGVGVTMEGGRLYQTHKDEALKFPLNQLRQVVEAGLKGKIAFECPVQTLLTSIEGLSGFVSVMGHDACEVVLNREKSELTLTLKFASGTIRRVAAVTVKGSGKFPENYRWSLGKVSPWLRYLAKRDDACSIICRRTDTTTVLYSNAQDKKKRVLVFADC